MSARRGDLLIVVVGLVPKLRIVAEGDRRQRGKPMVTPSLSVP